MSIRGFKSHLTWVRGLKLFERFVYVFNQRSHLTWVRGLKLPSVLGTGLYEQSHLTWVRGLKHLQISLEANLVRVAPYVGAWVETKFGNLR